MKKYIIVFSVLFLSTFMAATMFAAHPLVTDDIGIVGVGEYELELSYDNCKVGEEPRSHSCGLSLKHGITGKMDIGISFPYQIEPKPVEPLGTATLAVKLLLIKDIFALSMSNELGSMAYSINGIFTHEFQPITVHANIGYNTSGDENKEGEIGYSAAFEYLLAKIKIELVGEVIGDKIGFQNWLLGVRYKFAETFFVDFAYGNGFRNPEEKISSGLHIEF